MRRRLQIATILAVTVLGAPSFAHKIPIERSLMVTVHPNRIEILAIYAEPPGIRTEWLLGLFDFDRDGRLDGRELVFAAPELAIRAFTGVQMTLNGKPIPASVPEAKCKREQNKGLSCALYLDLSLPEAPEALQIQLAGIHGVLVTPTQINVADGVSVSDLVLSGEPARSGDIVYLHPGSALTAQLHSNIAKAPPLK